MDIATFAALCKTGRPPANAVKTSNRIGLLATGSYPAKPSELRKFAECLEGAAALPPEWEAKRRRKLRKSAPHWPGRKLSKGERRTLVGSGVRAGSGGRSLMESVSQAGIEVSAEPILRNVRVLGADSKNRRQYTPDAMRQAIQMYEGAKVNIDHPGKPTDPRYVENRFGKLVNVRLDDGGGLVADLMYNPKHPMAETVRWWADNMPECIGLSHNAVGEGRTAEDGTFVVSRIVRVRSVDLVADPATTAGLY